MTSSMSTMRAAVLKGYHQPLALEDVDLPSPQEGEARLKVLASGVCATDVHIREGKLDAVIPPRILGHEIVGTAEFLGKGVVGIDPGARYVVQINDACGQCIYCRAGRENLCPSRVRVGFERDGGHAEYVAVPAKNLVRIRESTDPAKAAIIPDAVACMYHALVDQCKLHEGQRIVIIGLGGLAYQGVQIAVHFGAGVIGTSRRKEKRELALGLGAQGACNTSVESLEACIRNIWGEEPPDAVVDNVGTVQTLQMALEITRRGGKVVVVGYETHDVPFNLYDLMVNEKEIIGARGSTLCNLQECVRLVELGVVDPLVTQTYALEDINIALRDLETGKIAGRGVILM